MMLGASRFRIPGWSDAGACQRCSDEPLALVRHTGEVSEEAWLPLGQSETRSIRMRDTLVLLVSTAMPTPWRSLLKSFSGGFGSADRAATFGRPCNVRSWSSLAMETSSRALRMPSWAAISCEIAAGVTSECWLDGLDDRRRVAAFEEKVPGCVHHLPGGPGGRAPGRSAQPGLGAASGCDARSHSRRHAITIRIESVSLPQRRPAMVTKGRRADPVDEQAGQQARRPSRRGIGRCAARRAVIADEGCSTGLAPAAAANDLGPRRDRSDPARRLPSRVRGRRPPPS